MVPKFGFVHFKTDNAKWVVRLQDILNFNPQHCEDFDPKRDYDTLCPHMKSDGGGSFAMEAYPAKIICLGGTREAIFRKACNLRKRNQLPPSFLADLQAERDTLKKKCAASPAQTQSRKIIKTARKRAATGRMADVLKGDGESGNAQKSKASLHVDPLSKKSLPVQPMPPRVSSKQQRGTRGQKVKEAARSKAAALKSKYTPKEWGNILEVNLVNSSHSLLDGDPGCSVGSAVNDDVKADSVEIPDCQPVVKDSENKEFADNRTMTRGSRMKRKRASTDSESSVSDQYTPSEEENNRLQEKLVEFSSKLASQRKIEIQLKQEIETLKQDNKDLKAELKGVHERNFKLQDRLLKYLETQADPESKISSYPKSVAVSCVPKTLPVLKPSCSTSRSSIEDQILLEDDLLDSSSSFYDLSKVPTCETNNQILTPGKSHSYITPSKHSVTSAANCQSSAEQNSSKIFKTKNGLNVVTPGKLQSPIIPSKRSINSAENSPISLKDPVHQSAAERNSSKTSKSNNSQNGIFPGKSQSYVTPSKSSVNSAENSPISLKGRFHQSAAERNSSKMSKSNNGQNWVTPGKLHSYVTPSKRSFSSAENSPISLKSPFHQSAAEQNSSKMSKSNIGQNGKSQSIRSAENSPSPFKGTFHQSAAEQNSSEMGDEFELDGIAPLGENDMPSSHAPTSAAANTSDQEEVTTKKKKNEKEGNESYATNKVLAPMIFKAISTEDLSGLQEDGTGQVHIGNNVWIRKSIFEGKFGKKSTVKNTIALGDLAEIVWTKEGLAKLSLEGGRTPNPNCTTRTVKEKATPRRKEAVLGCYRARLMLQGTLDENILDKMVTLEGLKTLKEKFSRAAKKAKKELFSQ